MSVLLQARACLLKAGEEPVYLPPGRRAVMVTPCPGSGAVCWESLSSKGLELGVIQSQLHALQDLSEILVPVIR